MPAERDRRPSDAFVWAWTGFVVVLIYLPILCGVLASLGKSRYFRFPVAAVLPRLVAAHHLLASRSASSSAPR